MENIYEENDRTGFYLSKQRPIIESIFPLEGKEGDIITLKGLGFSQYIRNNCVVLGGMGACARPQEGTTETELKVRIDPVPNISEGEVLMWPGAGSYFYNEAIGYQDSKFNFTETAIFRNGSPVSAGNVNFKLTHASKNAFGCSINNSVPETVNLSGHERENTICVKIPSKFDVSSFSGVDVCLVLKEHPTVAIDFTAEINSGSLDSCLKLLARAVSINGRHIGEKIFSDVVENKENGEYELYVTKPYLENGLMTIHFS